MAKVLIYSPNIIGKSMAGAAIRSWEFAKALSKHHQVILISPGQVLIKAKEFEVVSFHDPLCKRHFKEGDILIAQRLTLPLAFWANSNNVKVIIDAYDPSPLELLEHFKSKSMKERHEKVNGEITTLSFSFKMADGILCASEKQRELWIGFLLAQKLIHPSLYEQDPSLRHYLDVVPFGLSPLPPEKKGNGWREKYHLDPKDKVVLWGGGIWNWFDPLSLIRAMKIITQKRGDIKLIFMAVQPPDPHLPEMSMAREAIKLAEELKIKDKCVFFNDEWIPYEERENYLLDADIGVSTHFDHLETHFSFRTRLLDYIWATLPMIVTEGDSFGELVILHQLGLVVPYQNAQGIADAILSLADDQRRYKEIKENLSSIRGRFYWDAVLAPLEKMIQRLTTHCEPRNNWKDKKHFLSFVVGKVREKGVKASFQKVFQQYF